MPIRVKGKTLPNFDAAVAHVMKAMGLSKKRASAYVAEVMRRQEGTPRKRKR